MIESSASEHEQMSSMSFMVSFDLTFQGPSLPDPCCPLLVLITDVFVSWLQVHVYLHRIRVSSHMSVITPHAYESAGTESPGLTVLRRT